MLKDHSREEIEKLFDAWAERDLGIPTNTFFAALEGIGTHRPPQRVETV